MSYLEKAIIEGVGVTMMCPKCKCEDLLQLHPGIDTLLDDGCDVMPNATFVCRGYDCPNCGVIQMFFDYDRTEKEDNQEVIHINPCEEARGVE